MKNLKLLSRVALSFQNLENFNKQMQIILKDIGSCLEVSRIYIFFYENQGVLSNTFEWCNEGIAPQIQNLQKINFEDVPSWNNMFIENGSICSKDISELPKDMAEVLIAQDIKSLLVYPLMIENRIGGFIGLDECMYKREWTKEEIEVFSTVSGIISKVYTKRFLNRHIIESEANFRNFFETIADMFVVSNLNGEIIHCNKSLIDKLGYSLEELRNMNVVELHAKADRDKASKILSNITKGKKDYCPLKIESKTGELYLLDTRTWFGKWNKKDCIYSISKDITIENESLKLFTKIFEHNPLAMAITSKKDRKFTKVNPEFLKKTGYSEQEILGKSVTELGLVSDLEKLNLPLNNLHEDKGMKNEDFVIKRKNGEIIHGLLSIQLINNQGKESYLGVLVDVTEKAELAKDLEIELSKLTNIIKGSNLGTWEWNIKTGHVIFNEQAARMTGHTLDEIKSTNITDLTEFVHPEDAKRSENVMKKHLQGDFEYYSCEIRLKHKDGRWIWIQNIGKVTQRDEEGNPLKLFGTQSDITIRKESCEMLEESEKRFMLALDETEAGLWDIDLITGKVFLSPMWKNMLGYRDDEIENTFEDWKILWHPDDIDQIKRVQDEYLNGKETSYRNVYRLKHKDGSWRWILSRGGILRDDDGVQYRWIGTNTDITLEHEKSLELERVFSINLDLLCILDMQGHFIKTNRAWEDLLGHSEFEFEGHNIVDFIHKDDISGTTQVMAKLNQGLTVDRFINRYRHVNGDYHYMEWRAKPYEGLIYAAARDVTERVKYEKKILEISNRDALTNVYNRRYVFNKAKEIIKEYKDKEKVLSVCILDIDYFKDINDTYGHQIGDCVLKEFTKIMSENLRDCDVLGRYGGEEFIIILKDTNNNRGNLVLERISKIIKSRKFVFDEHNVKFTFSAGISSSDEFAKEEITIDKLIGLADSRMYQAKNNGRDKIIFEETKL